MGLSCDYPRTRTRSGGDQTPSAPPHPRVSPASPAATALQATPATVSRAPAATASHGVTAPREPFWARLNTEAAEYNADAEIASGSREHETQSSHLSLLSTPQVMSNAALFPTPADAFRLWQLYVDNVDPLIKIIHTPTFQAQLLEASTDYANLEPSFEALLFAIFYAAAITTHQPDMSSPTAEQSRTTAQCARYRAGLNQALVKARFVESRDLVALQAFVIYLVCARFDPLGPSIWTLLALAVRIGMRLGLHHESNKRRTFFDEEMRRRLWWQICILDVRTAEDAGTHPLVAEVYLRTPIPANVSDLDLHRDMSRSPISLHHGTAMFFNNLRIDAARYLRPILFDTAVCESTLQNKREAIDRLWQRLDDEYFSHCDLQIPLCGFAVSTVKLVLAKGRLGIHITAGPRTEGWCDETDDYLFRESLGILEQYQSLAVHPPYMRWWWLVRTYVEWDALVLVLRGLCRKPAHAMAQCAWRVVEIAFSSASTVIHSPDHRQRWECLRRLRARAQAARAEPTRITNGPISPDSTQVAGRSTVLENNRQASDPAVDALTPLPEDWNWFFDGESRIGPAWCEDQDLRELLGLELLDPS